MALVTLARAHQGGVAGALKPFCIRSGMPLLAANTPAQVEHLKKHTAKPLVALRSGQFEEDQEVVERCAELGIPVVDTEVAGDGFVLGLPGSEGESFSEAAVADGLMALLDPKRPKSSAE